MNEICRKPNNCNLPGRRNQRNPGHVVRPLGRLRQPRRGRDVQPHPEAAAPAKGHRRALLDHHPGQFGAEVFTGQKGKYVALKETIRGFKAIIAGEYDHLPEQAFYMVGPIEEAIEKGKGMA